MEIHVEVQIAIKNFNLLPNECLESFWDAMWLGIWTFSCFKVCKIGTTYRCSLIDFQMESKLITDAVQMTARCMDLWNYVLVWKYL